MHKQPEYLFANSAIATIRSLSVVIAYGLVFSCTSFCAGAENDDEAQIRESAFTYFQRWQSPSARDAKEIQFGYDYNRLRKERYIRRFAEVQAQSGVKPKNGITIPKNPPRLETEMGFEAKNQTVEDLFFGRFGEINKRTDRQWNGDLAFASRQTQVLADVLAKNPDFRVIVNVYVGEASKRFGVDQLNGSKAWQSTKELVTKRGFYEIKRERISQKTFYVDSKLSPVYRADTKGISTFLSMIRQVQLGNANYLIDIKNDVLSLFDTWEKGSSEHAQFIENMVRFFEKRQSLQDEFGDRFENAYSDRFFTSEVYRRWSNGKDVPGHLISKSLEGQSLNSTAISERALSIFLHRAGAQGIAEKDITRAMFSGELNPHPIDLLLVHRGLAPRNSKKLRNALFDFAVENRLAEPVDDVDKTLDFRNSLGRTHLIYLGYRETEWIRRFGGVESAVGVETIHGNEEVTLELAHIHKKLGRTLSQRSGPRQDGSRRSGRRRYTRETGGNRFVERAADDERPERTTSNKDDPRQLAKTQQEERSRGRKTLDMFWKQARGSGTSASRDTAKGWAIHDAASSHYRGMFEQWEVYLEDGSLQALRNAENHREAVFKAAQELLRITPFGSVNDSRRRLLRGLDTYSDFIQDAVSYEFP